MNLPSKSLLAAACAAVVVTGCSSSGVKNPSGIPVTEMKPDEKGFVVGTGVESTDLVRVTDKMARGILGTPVIANAATPPVVVLEPVINDTRFPVNKSIFLDRIQGELISKAQGRVRFLARERMDALTRERELKRTGQVTAAADPGVQEFIGADYLLTGKLTGLSSQAKAGVSDYILYSFQLINARTSEIVWAGQDEIKKQGTSDAVYR